MQSYLTSKRLMSKLGMLRCGKKTKTLIVVEGVTDYRVYKKILNPDTCEVIIGENKDNVVEAVTMCEKEQMEGILGIVDADFWHIENEKPQLSPMIFLTDAHDLECMMLCSKAFEYVFLEYGDAGKRARFERQVGVRLMEWMLLNVSKLGYLRKVSLDKNLELRFSQMQFEKFMDLKRLEIIDEKMIQEILFESRKQNQYKVKQVKHWLDEAISSHEKQDTQYLWQVCCGHDLMEWLTLGFVHIFGHYNAKKLFQGQLEGSFRLTYHTGLFLETHLYKKLQEWEKSQETYRLFTTDDDEQVV